MIETSVNVCYTRKIRKLWFQMDQQVFRNPEVFLFSHSVNSILFMISPVFQFRMKENRVTL